MIIAVALSFVDRAYALWPRRLLTALHSGARSVLPVAATTATAGIIVGTVTLTGLGLKISGLIVDLAGGYLFLTVLYSALAIWMLGLAVPVTASYIIAAVMVAPAMIKVGVPDLAAHMFIFYYAVLSEVSPPTALSPFAAAAITGAKPVPTMMLTWKYTLPAFVFPFAFTLSPQGMGLLLQAPLGDIFAATATAVMGIVALGAGLGGWIRSPATPTERVLLVIGGLLLFYASIWQIWRVLSLRLWCSSCTSPGIYPQRLQERSAKTRKMYGLRNRVSAAGGRQDTFRKAEKWQVPKIVHGERSDALAYGCCDGS